MKTSPRFLSLCSTTAVVVACVLAQDPAPSEPVSGGPKTYSTSDYPEEFQAFLRLDFPPPDPEKLAEVADEFFNAKELSEEEAENLTPEQAASREVVVFSILNPQIAHQVAEQSLTPAEMEARAQILADFLKSAQAPAIGGEP